MDNNVKFVNTSDLEIISDFVADKIISELEIGHRVLWLVAGGSSIGVIVATSKKIMSHDHKNLRVTLTDERYGSMGHPDSNWLQLFSAGFILPEATLIPVLADYDFQETAQVFAKNLEKELAEVDYVIGLFGIGPDGHTAGILPNSPAVFSNELTCSYDAGNFKRVTITPRMIPFFNEAIVYAQGEAKWPILEKMNQEISITDQPAHVLKKIDKLTIFTDYKN